MRSFNGKGFVPQAPEYSAQTIADITTPQGLAQLNEELRRIAGALKNKQAEQPVATAATPGIDSTSQTAPPQNFKQKLTVSHNDIAVISNIVEEMNFQDANGVIFDIVVINSRKVEITARIDESGLYKATRVGQILYSKNGSTFHRELPLTSLVSGVILNDDGIIMIV